MSNPIMDKLASVEKRYQDIEKLMSDPEVAVPTRIHLEAVSGQGHGGSTTV